MRKPVFWGILFSLFFSLNLDACDRCYRWGDSCFGCFLPCKEKSLEKDYKLNNILPQEYNHKNLTQRRFSDDRAYRGAIDGEIFRCEKIAEALDACNRDMCSLYMNILHKKSGAVRNNIVSFLTNAEKFIHLFPEKHRLKIKNDIVIKLQHIKKRKGCHCCCKAWGYLRKVLLAGGSLVTLVTGLSLFQQNGFIAEKFGPNWLQIILVAATVFTAITRYLKDRKEFVEIGEALDFAINTLKSIDSDDSQHSTQIINKRKKDQMADKKELNEESIEIVGDVDGKEKMDLSDHGKISSPLEKNKEEKERMKDE